MAPANLERQKQKPLNRNCLGESRWLHPEAIYVAKRPFSCDQLFAAGAGFATGVPW